jgi:uncharacterized phage-associated protein
VAFKFKRHINSVLTPFEQHQIQNKSNTMSTYDRQKLIEIVLYILNKTNGIDIYRLFKIMYFAEKEHLATWGDKIITDDFHAMPHGPVPTQLYNAIKKEARDTNLTDLLWSVIEPAGGDASNVLLPKRKPDVRYISVSEKNVLDKSIEENAKKLFNELKNLSHDKAWEDGSKRRPKIMFSFDIAKAAGATGATVEYIQEQQNLDRILA